MLVVHNKIRVPLNIEWLIYSRTVGDLLKSLTIELAIVIVPKCRKNFETSEKEKWPKRA